MCTLVVLSEQIEGYPLVVVGNRDERYDRRSQPPTVRGDVICPWDDQKDGTWMGVTRDGWFVGLTNQDDGHHDDNALSRGQVVTDVLHAETHCAAARILKSLELPRYNPFNLVFGRPGAMFLVRAWAGHQLEMEPLAQGISVVSNDCWNHHYDAKLEHAKNSAWSYTSDPPPDGGIETIRRYLLIGLSSHRGGDADPFQALCVHAEEYDFGTRSTSLITVSNHGDVEYWYSDGHPCQSTGLTLAGRLEHR